MAEGGPPALQPAPVVPATTAPPVQLPDNPDQAIPPAQPGQLALGC